ncbi:hypothetical protein BGZ67_007221 [Mortierella alpina]|nr:hypothetical protein BGZ67_007221 [Mortierella alpina]
MERIGTQDVGQRVPEDAREHIQEVEPHRQAATPSASISATHEALTPHGDDNEHISNVMSTFQPSTTLRPKASTSSISSTLSSSSNATTQTFMSTLSFSTATGPHDRHAEHGENGGQEDDEQSDIESVDVDILTPTDGPQSDPFESDRITSSYQNSHGYHNTAYPGQTAAPPQRHSIQLESSQSRPSSYVAESRRHTKTFSEQSSAARTVRGTHSSEPSSVILAPASPSIPPSTTARSPMSRQLLDDQELQAKLYSQHENAEEMMFASPEYRKSLALSVQSDLLAEDNINSSPSGARRSFAAAGLLVDTAQQRQKQQHQQSQYSNLLRDATLILEQQQQNMQGQVLERSSDTSDTVEGAASETELNQLAVGTVRAADALRESAHGQGLGSSDGQKRPQSGSIRSTRSTITRSRSRRFSAPGMHGSHHASPCSQSRHSTASGASYAAASMNAGANRGGDAVAGEAVVAFGARAPHAVSEVSGALEDDHEDMDGGRYLPGANSTSHVDSSVENSGARKYAIQPLQHHPTMQPFLHSGEGLNSSTSSSSLAATGSAGPLASPTLHSQNHLLQHPRLHHDYRPGVVFEYYQGEWDWLPNFDEMPPDHAGIVGNFMIDETTERDLFRPQFANLIHQTRQGTSSARPVYKEPGNFAVRFTTHIDITQDGVYSFWLSSNDGSVLYIANTLVVENDGSHYATEAEGRILLQAGKHPMVVEFFHRNGKMLEGFRSTGPSLSVSYRAPGPVWSFGLKAGPKRIVKSSNLFYDHGDLRLRNLLSEFGVDEDYSSMDRRSMDRRSHCMSPDSAHSNYEIPGPTSAGGGGHQQHQQHLRHGSGQYQYQYQDRPSRHRIMSGDMGQMQPSTRELAVQMENAKTTIKDLEQIIRDQADSHQKKMNELYSILQDTQSQVDRLVSGIKKATLFEAPRTTIHPSHNSNPAWRSTVVSIYVDAEEEYPAPPDYDGLDSGEGESSNESGTDSDEVLAKHLGDLERLKQLYFFSMALSVKMNCEMMGNKTPEYTSTSVQKLYEDCTLHSHVPVEGWPGYVSRHFAKRPTRSLPA